MELGIILGIASLAFAIGLPFSGWIIKRRKIFSKYFKTIEKSNDIMPRDLLDDRPYHKYYYKKGGRR